MAIDYFFCCHGTGVEPRDVWAFLLVQSLWKVRGSNIFTSTDRCMSLSLLLYYFSLPLVLGTSRTKAKKSFHWRLPEHISRPVTLCLWNPAEKKTLSWILTRMLPELSAIHRLCEWTLWPVVWKATAGWGVSKPKSAFYSEPARRRWNSTAPWLRTFWSEQNMPVFMFI